MNKSLGKKIKEARLKTGISQEKLGDLIGTSKQNISFWESDRHSPDLETLIKISVILNIPFSDFLNISYQDNFLPQSNRLIWEYFRFLDLSEIHASHEEYGYWLAVLDDYLIGGKELLIKKGLGESVVIPTEMFWHSDNSFVKDLKAFNARYQIIKIE